MMGLAYFVIFYLTCSALTGLIGNLKYFRNKRTGGFLAPLEAMFACWEFIILILLMLLGPIGLIIIVVSVLVSE
jgi:hypothetical protein